MPATKEEGATARIGGGAPAGVVNGGASASFGGGADARVKEEDAAGIR